MLDRAVAGVGQEVDVGVGRVLELLAVVQPADARLRVPVHAEGEAPVVVLLGVLQEDDPGRDCRQEETTRVGLYFNLSFSIRTSSNSNFFKKKKVAYNEQKSRPIGIFTLLFAGK